MNSTWWPGLRRAVIILVLLMIGARAALAQVADRKIYTFVLAEVLEARTVPGSNPLVWDAVGWIGGDYTRFWFKSSGSRPTTGRGIDADAQLLVGRLVAPFWDLQAGARIETSRDSGGALRTRTSAVLALEGLSPFRFELEPSLYVTDRGDVSAELTASYDLYVTQRVVAQPRLDVHAGVREGPPLGAAGGPEANSVGLRVRYEFRRDFAPYVGFLWGDGGTSRTAWVGGLRLWF